MHFAWPLYYKKGNMKQFKLEVSHATPQQLATIALELKIMSNGWTRHGPRILINGCKLQAPSLRIPGSAKSNKRQASSLTRP
jgi:hypothetical protein